MTASAYLRHPALLLVAVLLVISLAWFGLGYPVEMPRSSLAPGEKLQCLSYRPAPVPSLAAEATDAVTSSQIEADLASLAPHTSCVRTYMTGNGLDRVPEIARRHGMAVLQGIALGRDAESNNNEIDRAIVLARSHRAVIRAFVAGSESLSRGELNTSELGATVRLVREVTKLPVTYADRWETWLNADLLAPLVDFITIHVELYRADVPVPAAEAARSMLDARSKVAAKFDEKTVVIGEVGWPSAGRMRAAALPSPVNQARVIHDLVAAAKSDGLQYNLVEGIDEPWRRAVEGTAGGHWGLLDPNAGTAKFRWGRPVTNHPLWFMQGLIGAMLALVVFAAGFVAARSFGTKVPTNADWPAVALIALAGGLFVGWAVADIPLQARSIIDWIQASLLIAGAFVIPPVAAAAIIRRTPLEGFGAVLSATRRRALHPLARAMTILLVLFVVICIQLALGLVFEPATRDILFAPLTGPAVALLVVAFDNPRGDPSDSFAELAAAMLLAGAAIFIVFNETLWNWQALWFASVLLALALTCWRIRGGQMS